MSRPIVAEPGFAWTPLRGYRELVAHNRQADESGVDYFRRRSVVVEEKGELGYVLVRAGPGLDLQLPDSNAACYRVQADVDKDGTSSVWIFVDGPPGQDMIQFTQTNLNQSIALVINGGICTMPHMNSPMSSICVMPETADEAAELAELFRTGAATVSLSVVAKEVEREREERLRKAFQASVR